MATEMEMRMIDGVSAEEFAAMQDAEVGASVPPPTLAERVRLVHLLRISLANAKEELDRRRRLWEEQNAGWILMTRQLTGELETADRALREAAIAAYMETGSKTPTPGVGIKIGTKVTYDRADALSWAIKHGLFLDVQTRPFETFVTKHLDQAPDSVEIRAEPQAFIATDLGKVLEVAE